MAPEVGPAFLFGAVVELDGAKFPAKERSIGVRWIESLQVVDAGKGRLGQPDQFTMHRSGSLHHSGIVAEVAKFARCGRRTHERGSAQPRGVGLSASQGPVDEEEAGGNVVGQIVVVVHGDPNASTCGTVSGAWEQGQETAAPTFHGRRGMSISV